ncbi:MAG: xylan 1,4-beta-xylosidase [Oscillospiraceae bacterium]|jgi:xylan 1,4-beta-xylosidase|nr:xylan 1,4-beta-xylosidase [Oscillospiraceae bacterium]
MHKIYDIAAESTVPFRNNADFCVGTGRIGLALHREYFEQLKLVQEQIGFRYIRGHGLFHEDMSILQRRFDGTIEYNFTYLDRVMDSYLELNIRPFLELGFMPKAIASGQQEVFYWGGNVTPPTDYRDWTNLVQATLRHLIDRYGEDEAVSFPIEVWNEPNLGGFWKDADRREYFRLFKETILAVKELNPRFRVGGPSICGVDDVSWMTDFLDFVKAEKLPLDFVTRHLYTISLPEQSGRYGYPTLRAIAEATSETEGSRKIIDGYPEFKGMEMHVTEFNTSYSPRTPIHDTNLNAVYVAYLLSKLGDDNASYSYWTFGDVFEEQGVPFTLFHGGFGLVANGKIPKPTFYAFKFFKLLKGKSSAAGCVLRSDEIVVVKDGGTYRGVAWNLSSESAELELTLASSAERCLTVQSVAPDTCNPLKLWHDMGEPAYPSEAQMELLRQSAVPAVRSQRVSGCSVSLSLQPKELIYFELTPAPLTPDWGMDYARAELAW